MYKRVLLLTGYNPLEPFPDAPGVLNNTGNNVYARAIVSYFAGPNVCVMTRKQVERALAADMAWCRRNFDVVISYEACLFCSCYQQDMHEIADFFRSLGVPIFVIGVGVHVGRKANVNFVDSFSEAIRDYMDSVYVSGGEITVRGEFTRAVCEHVGYRDVFVSGCGSIYYNGAQYEINNEKVECESFRPILNGYYVDDIHPRIFTEYPQSVFFDQDVYYRAIRFPAAVGAEEMKKLASRQFKKLFATLIDGEGGDGRIQTWQSVPRWQSAIERCGASFSYGSRMHGNTMALMTRVPAFLRVIDARTEEMAEFYKIPNSTKIDFDERYDSLYDLYCSLDWTEYNENYQRILAEFGKWIDRKGLPNRMGLNGDIVSERINGEDASDGLLQDRENFLRRLTLANLRLLFRRGANGIWR